MRRGGFGSLPSISKTSGHCFTLLGVLVVVDIHNQLTTETDSVSSPFFNFFYFFFDLSKMPLLHLNAQHLGTMFAPKVCTAHVETPNTRRHFPCDVGPRKAKQGTHKAHHAKGTIATPECCEGQRKGSQSTTQGQRLRTAPPRSAPRPRMAGRYWHCSTKREKETLKNLMLPLPTPLYDANLIGIMSNTPTAVKTFLRKIGSKGGRKSQQHPERRRLNKLAAESRWRKRHPQPKPIELVPLGRPRTLTDEQRRENKLKDNKRYQSENRPKTAAHWKIKNEIRTGRMQRQGCEICNAPNAHAHHDDHGKPLEVRWLCAKHHGAREVKLRREIIVK